MKHVTYAVDRDQNLWSARIIIQLSSEQADVHVNRASGGAARIKLPDLQKYFIARNGCACLARQAGEQRSLTGGEFASVSTTTADLAPRPIHHDIRTGQTVGESRRWARLEDRAELPAGPFQLVSCRRAVHHRVNKEAPPVVTPRLRPACAGWSRISITPDRQAHVEPPRRISSVKQ